MMFAALAFMSFGADLNYTVTKIGDFYIQPVSISQIALNNRDEVGIASEQPTNGPGSDDHDTIFNAYFWSKGKTTTISEQKVSGKRVVPLQLTDLGVVSGQVLNKDYNISNIFTWSSAKGFATEPFDNSQNIIGVSPHTGTMFRMTVDGGKNYLEFVRGSQVTSRTEVGENFSMMSFNRRDVVVGSDTRDDKSYAVMISPGGKEVELRRPALPPGARTVSMGAFSINEERDILGAVSYLPTNGSHTVISVQQSVFWPSKGYPVLVADPKGVHLIKVNDKAQAVGYMGQPRARRAVFFDLARGLRDLNSLVPKGSPILATAVAINDKGSIVCTGTGLEVYLLKPVRS